MNVTLNVSLDCFDVKFIANAKICGVEKQLQDRSDEVLKAMMRIHKKSSIMNFCLQVLSMFSHDLIVF